MPLQNIDPVYAVQPAVVLALSVGLVAYWRARRSFPAVVLVFTLIAYAGAIAAKVVLQRLTAAAVVSHFGYSSVGTGLYLGLQTSIFEVGGAYLVARYAVSRSGLSLREAGAYGLGLSLWENGALLGIIPLVNYVSYYFILGSGTPLAQQLLATLSQSAPALFLPPSAALPSVAYGTLERVSSLLLHLSWGYLCVYAACLRRKGFFLLALPMGLADALVPFAGVLSTMVFELLLFGLSSLLLVLALASTRRERERAAGPLPAQSPAP